MQNVRGPFLTIFRAAAGPLALAISIAAPSVHAQTIYKWVDEHGIVNYGNADVPKKREITVVDTTPPVVIQSSVKPRDAVARPVRLSDADMLREELVRSREEIARLKQAAPANPAQDTQVAGSSKVSPKPAAAGPVTTLQ